MFQLMLNWSEFDHSINMDEIFKHMITVTCSICYDLLACIGIIAKFQY
jgi:hypothetical protein